MTLLKAKIFGHTQAPPANDHTQSGWPSLDAMAEEVVDARNTKVHHEAAVHAAEMQLQECQEALNTAAMHLAECQDRFRAECNKRDLLARTHGTEKNQGT